MFTHIEPGDSKPDVLYEFGVSIFTLINVNKHDLGGNVWKTGPVLKKSFCMFFFNFFGVCGFGIFEMNENFVYWCCVMFLVVFGLRYFRLLECLILNDVGVLLSFGSFGLLLLVVGLCFWECGSFGLLILDGSCCLELFAHYSGLCAFGVCGDWWLGCLCCWLWDHF